MFGRDEQLHLLMESFRAVQLTGISEVCVVSGHAGAGKTHLVYEAMTRMREEGAMTAYAKFDQFNQDIPFTAIVYVLFYGITEIGTDCFRHYKTNILHEY
jgi:predicted ATPase